MLVKRFFIAITLFFLVNQAIAQIPQTLSYQGVLTNSSGTPLPNANYQLTFRIYDMASGGTALWTEIHPTVQTDNGFFTVSLGSITTLNLAFDKQYHLSIQVDSDPEMSPRIALDASAYSLNAKSVEDNAITSSKIASGTVIRTVNSITDSVNFVAGANITISPVGNDITISSSASGSGGNTLDGAYDEGGPGAGRTIIADNGAVEINGTDGLVIMGNSTGAPTLQLELNNTATVLNDTLGQMAFYTNDATYTGRASGVVGVSAGTGGKGQLLFMTDGYDEKLRIDHNGHVGIGHTIPSTNLHVRNSNTGTNTLQGVLTLDAQTSGTPADGYGPMLQGFLTNGVTQNALAAIGFERDGVDNQGRIVFQTHTAGNYVTRMTVKNNGNVGIGTSPNAPFDALLSSANGARIQFESTTNGASNIQAINNTDTGTIALALNPGGSNVGIGTTGPISNLHVSGSTSGVQGITLSGILQSGAASQYTGLGFETNAGKISSAIQFEDSSQKLYFYTNTGTTGSPAWQARITLQNDGNIGIGTSTADYFLDIFGPSAGNGKARYADVGSNAANKSFLWLGRQFSSDAEPEGFTLMRYSASSGSNHLIFGGSSPDHNAATALSFYTASNEATRDGIERMRIDSSGIAVIGSGSGHNVGNAKLVVFDGQNPSTQTAGSALTIEHNTATIPSASQETWGGIMISRDKGSAVVSGEPLGGINFGGRFDSENRAGYASIGAIAAGSGLADLVLMTAGTSSLVQSEKVRIGSTGNVVRIKNDGTGNALSIDHNTTSSAAIQTDTGLENMPSPMNGQGAIINNTYAGGGSATGMAIYNGRYIGLSNSATHTIATAPTNGATYHYAINIGARKNGSASGYIVNAIFNDGDNLSGVTVVSTVNDSGGGAACSFAWNGDNLEITNNSGASIQLGWTVTITRLSTVN